MLVSLTLALALAAAPTPKEKPMSFFDFKTNTLDGKPADLAQYKGKVVLQDSIENLKSSLNPDLQKVFASVTNQEDYEPIARAILAAVRKQ